jgi:hypothetical protein
MIDKIKKTKLIKILYNVKYTNNLELKILNKLYNKNRELYDKYPILFSKYKLNIANEQKKINYIVYNENIIKVENKKNICHIHTNYLDNLIRMFGKNIEFLMDMYLLIVTYSNGDINICDKYVNNIIFIKRENKGFDIGGKICCFDYIYKRNIPYNYILCLHTKTDNEKRLLYSLPLIKDIERVQIIENLFKNDEKLCGIFPNLILDYTINPIFINGNIAYYSEILDFLNCKKVDKFVEGNFMILSKCVIDYIFKSNLKIFYNNLNDENTFDYNWFNFFYKKNLSLTKSYELFIKEKLNGNDFWLKNNNEMLRDAMFEHVFERIYLNVIEQLKGNYLLLVESDIQCDKNLYYMMKNNEYLEVKINSLNALKEFDVSTYKSRNIDIKNFDNNDALRHYITNGYKEGRPCEKISIMENYHDIFKNYSDNINNCPNTYLISAPDIGGGTQEYCENLIESYKNVYYVFSLKQLMGINLKKNDIIWIHHFILLDITIEDVLRLYNLYNFKIYITIHDMYWLTQELYFGTSKTHNIYIYRNEISILENVKKLFDIADIVIHPSKFTFNIYSEYFDSKNFKICDHNDYEIDASIFNIPKIQNNIINIGMMTGNTEYKGIEFVQILQNKYKKYKNYEIKFLITNETISKYSKKEYYSICKKYNIHCLLFLNKWAETWCYALTKALNTGLPILYNDIGVFKERIPNRIHYMKVFDEKNFCEINLDETKILFDQFEKMLEFIIKNNCQINEMNEFYKMKHQLFYNNLLEQRIQLQNNIKLFAIYFPQFHEFEENNIQFYKGYNDILNLSLIETDKETPFLCELGINNLLSYNLTDINLINKQMKIAKDNGVYGFAIYYYYFSNNTVTGKKILMDDVVNLFFDDDVNNDFPVYFLWANENWTGNPAFGNSNHEITNIYNKDSFIDNIDNLMLYFKKNQYYKINNKPVFGIHHPWLINDLELFNFIELLDKKCKMNGFGGTYLMLNNMMKSYDNFMNYKINPEYKSTKFIDVIQNQNFLNYEKYIDSYVSHDSNDIQTIFFDFDNTARLIKPDRKNISTKCINNTDELKLNFSKKLFASSIQKNKSIIMFNAWNEWGEKMHLEPSNEKKSLYLNILKNAIKSIYDNVHVFYIYNNKIDNEITLNNIIFIQKYIKENEKKDCMTILVSDTIINIIYQLIINLGIIVINSKININDYIDEKFNGQINVCKYKIPFNLILSNSNTDFLSSICI